MFSRLRPLDVELSLEERDYSLGDTLSLTVKLLANRDSRVREGRVELIHEVSFHEAGFVDVFPSFNRTCGLRFTVGNRVSDGTKTSVVSNEVFLTDVTLASGRWLTCEVKVVLPTEPPPGAGGRRGPVGNWGLHAVLDIEGARDPVSRLPIHVIDEATMATSRTAES